MGRVERESTGSPIYSSSYLKKRFETWLNLDSNRLYKLVVSRHVISACFLGKRFRQSKDIIAIICVQTVGDHSDENKKNTFTPKITSCILFIYNINIIMSDML